ncbi:homing endonuclease [Vibrio phage EniLVp02]
MHVVYKVVFNDRFKSKTPPYFYIGSKSNCTVSNGVILDSRGSPYYGSATYPGYHDLVNRHTTVEILHSSDEYDGILEQEATFQREVDAHTNIEYFNLAIAVDNNFTTPGYGSYKHKDDFNKTVRLPVDHPLVLNGTYVGVTKGYPCVNRKSRGLPGKLNPFYGKKHTPETLERIRQSNIGRKATAEARANMSKARKGIPKSAEHRRKIGRKGYIMLKNPTTGESRRVSKSDPDIQLLIDQGWKNPAAIAITESTEVFTCPHCGATSKSRGNMTRWHFDNCKAKR